MTLSRAIGLNLNRSFCTYLSYKIRFSLCKQSASTIEINTTVYSDRSLPSQHRVQQNTQTPNITSSIITLPFQHLKSYQSKVRIARQIYSYSTFDKIQYYNCQRDTENTFGIQYICDDATAFYRLPRKTWGVEIVKESWSQTHAHKSLLDKPHDKLGRSISTLQQERARDPTSHYTEHSVSTYSIPLTCHPQQFALHTKKTVVIL